MTTPPGPAGWYPDPDGSGGQRYWDGTSWTEHRSPAEVADPPANEEPTAVVQLRSVPNEEHVGAHRKPDFDSAPAAIPPKGNRSLIIGYGAACAALLVVLIGLAIYGFLIKKTPETQLSTPGGGDITTEVPRTRSSGSWDAPWERPSAAPTTEAPATPLPTGETTDGPMSFTVHGIDIGPTVVMSDPPIEKIAEGEFIVVHMTVTNVGTDAESFVGMFQTLRAGGTTYRLADEATAYLGDTATELAPGASADVSLAFDVPPGTVPEAIELHAEPGSPGVQVPLP
jgi:Protein of unknown function (DUF2510)/Domain of unknown function (DUF4352)